MSNLIENILSEDFVSASELFESRMEQIAEQKLLEAKKQIQSESFGILKFTKADIEAKKKAGYRKASDVLGDPAKTNLSAATKKYRKSAKQKEVSEEQIDEIRLSGDVAGTLGRKITAKGIKLARKLPFGKDFSKSYIKSRTSQISADKHDQGTGAEIGSRLGAAKHIIKSYLQQRKLNKQAKANVSDDEFAKQSSRAAGAAPSHGDTEQGDKKPGIIKRNINTLLGRKPGYVKPKTPDDEKGGRVGKVVRGVGKGVGKGIGKIGGAILSDIASSIGE